MANSDRVGIKVRHFDISPEARQAADRPRKAARRRAQQAGKQEAQRLGQALRNLELRNLCEAPEPAAARPSWRPRSALAAVLALLIQAAG